MFAIAFDLVVAEAEKMHAKGAAQAYTDIARTLREFHFERVQGSVYVTENILTWMTRRCPIRKKKRVVQS